jgi:nucleoid-associated protein EbfC
MFKAIGGLGNISAILNNLQHIGPTVRRVTEEMRDERITASAGDGAVEVTMNGVGEMLHLAIISEVRDHEELHVWIIEATNTAATSAKRQFAGAIAQAAEDMDLKIPGLDALLGSLTGGA